MTLTGALDSLSSQAISGGTGLLTGSTGQIIVFFGIVAIVLLVVYAFRKFIGMGHGR